MAGTFVISVRQREHSSLRYIDLLVAGTVSKAVSNLATNFLDHDQPDPRLSVDGKIDRHITKIIKSFKQLDPRE